MRAELMAAFPTSFHYMGEGLLGFVAFTYFPLALQSERVRFLGKVKICRTDRIHRDTFILALSGDSSGW